MKQQANCRWCSTAAPVNARRADPLAVEAGIRKVNFATDLCYAFLDQVMVTERTTVALDVFMRDPIRAIRDYCIGKIRLLGADRIL